jgi:hypothetical protein
MSIDQHVRDLSEKRLILTTNEMASLECSIVRWTEALAAWKVFALEDGDDFARKMVRDLTHLREQARERLETCKKSIGRHHGFAILASYEH